MTIDRTPPHNAEAEAACLGAVMIDPAVIAELIDVLRPDSFYRPANKKIFSAMISLFDGKQPIESISISKFLKDSGDLNTCGGAAYLSELTSGSFNSVNVGFYADIINDLSKKRDLLRLSSLINAAAYDVSNTAIEVIESAGKKLFELADQQGGGYEKIGDLLYSGVESIERTFKLKGEPSGVPTGFSELDRMTSGLQRSELIIIGARPSVGKTALALNMAANISIENKIPVGFFSMEMSKAALVKRIICSEARVSTSGIRYGLLRPNDFKSITDAASRIQRAPLFIDDSPNLPLLNLRSTARRMVSQEGVKIIFIDYITLIKPETKEAPRHEQIAEISRSLKALARELNIPVVVLTQVRRETEGKRPSLADIRESGSIEQDADVVLFLHRVKPGDKDSDDSATGVETELVVAKHRNGPVGILKLAFLTQYTKFEPLSRA